MDKKVIDNAILANRILLGLVMLVPGVMKLFVVSPSGVTGMLTSLGFPMPSLLAWILIFSEIIFGLAVLANYKLRYTTIPPMIILVIAAFTASISSIPSILLHLVAVSNYMVFALMAKD